METDWVSIVLRGLTALFLVLTVLVAVGGCAGVPDRCITDQDMAFVWAEWREMGSAPPAAAAPAPPVYYWGGGLQTPFPW